MVMHFIYSDGTFQAIASSSDGSSFYRQTYTRYFPEIFTVMGKYWATTANV